MKKSEVENLVALSLENILIWFIFVISLAWPVSTHCPSSPPSTTGASSLLSFPFYFLSHRWRSQVEDSFLIYRWRSQVEDSFLIYRWRSQVADSFLIYRWLSQVENSFLIYRWRSQVEDSFLIYRWRSQLKYCFSIQMAFKGKRHRMPTPYPPFSTRGKAGRNHLNQEITPLLPTGVGEWFSQTISNLGHLAPMRIQTNSGPSS